MTTRPVWNESIYDPKAQGIFSLCLLRTRFVESGGFEPQANEIPNTMPSWMPGEDYYTNFRKGDPYIKVDQGFARLPGDGYAALHPELKDVNPEDYPDIHKMAILADIAPYSREYNTFRQKVGKEAQGNTELEIEYQRILDRVRQTKDSVVRMQDRKFTAPVDELEGTVASVSPSGITLKEFPGRKFQFSSVGMSAADMSARILGEQNNLTRAEAAINQGFSSFALFWPLLKPLPQTEDNPPYLHIYELLALTILQPQLSDFCRILP